MGFTRRRSDRSGPARRSHSYSPELLESRQLLSTAVPNFLSPYIPSDLLVTNPITHQREPFSVRQLVQKGNPNSPLLSNQGKVVTGKDRQGDEWTITVHGPGQVIVTDTTPNDGSLDDDIATIQIINSDPRRTYVTGNVIASARVVTDGTVKFARLIATSGVKAIDLNGFNLTADVSPATNLQPGIFLYGGVERLSFHDILALIDTAANSPPYQIVIGDPTTPLTVKPSIYLDSIFNSVFDSTSSPSDWTPTTIPTGPLTTPSVQFSINGVVQNFSIVSTTQSPVPPVYQIQTKNGTTTVWSGVPASGPVPPAYQFFYNVVGTTGRTSLQATAVNHLNVVGSANNFTVQRDTTPFGSSLSGLKYLRRARFGGNADAVALDVNGPIGKVQFNRGLGNPSGVFTAKVPIPTTSSGQSQRSDLLPASIYGIPLGSTGYPGTS
jgi:hypothetical protein